MKSGNKKAIRTISLVLLIIALCPFLLGAAPDHTNEFYVNDYADVLSDATEQQILNTAVKLANETTAQVCVLTIDSLDGEDISEYSVEVFRDWGIGNKEKDNGVLIVLSVDDREMWVTTGYGVEGTLTDTRLGQFRDTYAFPYYREDDFDEGTLQLFNAIVNELRVEEYGLSELENFQNIEPDYYYEYQGEELSPEAFGFILFLLCLPALVVMIGVPSLIIRYFYLKQYDKLHGTNRLAAFMVKMNKLKEIILFIVLFTRRSSRGHYHHRGGGGFGGGGFGGGGFRGGGGSTGGGGAGGRF